MKGEKSLLQLVWFTRSQNKCTELLELSKLFFNQSANYLYRQGNYEGIGTWLFSFKRGTTSFSPVHISLSAQTFTFSTLVLLNTSKESFGMGFEIFQ
jgi:hypothetical protein